MFRICLYSCTGGVLLRRSRVEVLVVVGRLLSSGFQRTAKCNQTKHEAGPPSFVGVGTLNPRHQTARHILVAWDREEGGRRDLVQPDQTDYEYGQQSTQVPT